jgi:GNAT superfamily N-acetyltransferase
VNKLKAIIKNITESNLDDIPEPCSCCTYWSSPKEFERTKSELSKKRQELKTKKRLWILQTLREFGNCGKILYYNGTPIGYAEYGPSDRFPQIKEYRAQPIGKIEEGIVFLACLYVVNQNLRGKGFGERLLDSVIADLKRRGFRAVETYARRGSPNNPSGPVELYFKKGFRIKNEADPEFPIVKLNLQP